MKKNPRTANGLACERQTYFPSSLLSLRKATHYFSEGEKWQPEIRLRFAVYQQPSPIWLSEEFFESNYFQNTARFSNQNSTIALVFKVWHSFNVTSTFGFKVRHLFLMILFRFFFFFFFSIQHSFLNTFVLFNSTFNFFIRNLFFKFVIRFINSSSRFSTLTFVFQVQNSFY